MENVLQRKGENHGTRQFVPAKNDLTRVSAVKRGEIKLSNAAQVPARQETLILAGPSAAGTWGLGLYQQGLARPSTSLGGRLRHRGLPRAIWAPGVAGEARVHHPMGHREKKWWIS